MLAIIHAELVMRDHLIPEAVLFIEDGKIAGFGEMRTTDIPEGCEWTVIPGGMWAQFKCKGPLPNSLQSVNTQIWSEWLPSLKGYSLAGNYSLEIYEPPTEKPEDYESYIWIPLKKD